MKTKEPKTEKVEEVKEMKEKTKTPKEPKQKKEKPAKEPKVKKAEQPVDSEYIGRPKPMKTKKFEFHKPTAKFYVELGIWIVVLAGIGYLAFLLSRVDEGKITNVQRYEFTEQGQPEAYVLENNYLKLSLDPFTTAITVLQKDTGRVWRSNPENVDSDPIALPKEKDKLRSPFFLKYGTNTGLETLYDFSSFSVEKKVYEISQTKDEISVSYSVGDIEPIYWYPMAIYEKDMDKWLEKMSSSEQRAVKANYRLYQIGKFLVSDDQAQILADYPMINDGATYVLKNNIQKHLKVKVQEIFAKYGYGYDDFVKDSENYAGGKEKNIPGFNVTVVYKLDGNKFSVEVPYDKIAYKTDYPIIRISILPYFGASTVGDEGFLLIPEGGGSIINFNNGKTLQNAYYSDIYGWDYGSDRKAVMTETRSAFPVFGIAYNDSSFISIMDKGAEYGGVNADISGRMNLFNFVYAEYKLVHSELFEATSQNQSSMYTYEKELPAGESIKQVYSFLDSGSYVDMANNYKDYLFGSKKTKTKNSSVPVAVEILGSIDKVQQVMGVPDTRPYKLTSYKETDEIISRINKLGLDNVSYKLSGFFNTGIKQKLLKKFKFIKKLGGKSDFKKLIENNPDEKLYLDGTVQYSYKTGFAGGFNKYKDAARFVSTKIAELSEYSPIYYGKYDANVRDTYFLVKPSLSEKLSQNLTKNAVKYNLKGVSYRDNGYFLSSDFNSKDTTTRAEAKEGQLRQFQEAKDKGLGVMINAGNSYAVSSVDFITNLNMHGNDYAIIDKTIPFYQIALHGNVNFAGTPINLAPENKQGILEAAESGAALYFTFMHDKETRLQETFYTEYYASNFDNWEKELEAIYKEYNKNMAGVIDSYISDHQYISDTVTVTTFDNGKKVYVNFGYVDYITEDGLKIPAREYKVTGGR